MENLALYVDSPNWPSSLCILRLHKGQYDKIWKPAEHLHGHWTLFIYNVLDRLNKFNRIEDNFIGKAIVSLSLCSYAVYFSHTIVVKELSYHNPESNLLFPVMFVLVVFLSWLLPYVLSKIPYLRLVEFDYYMHIQHCLTHILSVQSKHPNGNIMKTLWFYVMIDFDWSTHGQFRHHMDF